MKTKETIRDWFKRELIEPNAYAICSFEAIQRVIDETLRCRIVQLLKFPKRPRHQIAALHAQGLKIR